MPICRSVAIEYISRNGLAGPWNTHIWNFWSMLQVLLPKVSTALCYSQSRIRVTVSTRSHQHRVLSIFLAYTSINGTDAKQTNNLFNSLIISEAWASFAPLLIIFSNIICLYYRRFLYITTMDCLSIANIFPVLTFVFQLCVRYLLWSCRKKRVSLLHSLSFTSHLSLHVPQGYKKLLLCFILKLVTPFWFQS